MNKVCLAKHTSLYLKSNKINKVQHHTLNVVLYSHQLTSKSLAFIRDTEVQMHRELILYAILQYVVKFGVLIILHIM
jgi:hypothetical protein